MDLGCGQGANTWFLAREGFNVLAADGSLTAVRKCMQRMSYEGTDRRVVGGSFDFAVIPCDPEIFDAVVDVVSTCHNSIHVLPDIYRNVARILKPGGRFFMMCPTDYCSPEPLLGHGPISFICELDLRLLLQEWFDIVELTKSSYQPTSAHRVEHWVVSAVKR